MWDILIRIPVTTTKSLKQIKWQFYCQMLCNKFKCNGSFGRNHQSQGLKLCHCVKPSLLKAISAGHLLLQWRSENSREWRQITTRFNKQTNKTFSCSPCLAVLTSYSRTGRKTTYTRSMDGLYRQQLPIGVFSTFSCIQLFILKLLLTSISKIDFFFHSNICSVCIEY